MPQDMVKVRTTMALKKLRPVLIEWTNMVLDYCANHPNDGCWWYTERATLGVLSAAAWRCDWNALEEYSTKKAAVGDKSDPTVHRVKAGRCDLYLAKGNHSYALEAKQAWQPIGDRVHTDKNNRTADALDGAWSNVRELAKEEADRRLALTFVVPSFPNVTLPVRPKERIAKATELIDDWTTRLQSQFNWDAYAHVFPGRTRLLMPEKGRRVFPGVVALFQVCHRGRRLAVVK